MIKDRTLDQFIAGLRVIHKVIVKYIDIHLIPFALAVDCLLLNKTLAGIIFLSAGCIFFLSCFVVTVKLNLPIYNQVIAWTGIGDATDWKDVRRRFFILNIIRMSGAVFSFALLSINGLLL